MRYSTASGLVLAALTIGEAVAGPVHSHRHAKMHQKKDIDYSNVKWDELGIDWKAAWAAGQKSAPATAPAVASPAPAAAAAAAKVEDTVTKVASSANSIVDDIADLFNGIVGVSNDRTSFGDVHILPGGSATSGANLQGDFFNGNIGKPYGANMCKVSSTDGYDYTAKFTNTQKKAITVNCWNKAGEDLQPLSGSSLAPKKTALTFALKAGASQTVAFQVDSQVACSEAVKETTASGAYQTTWAEFNFPSTGGVGYDTSAINCPGNNYKMSITSAEAPKCTSSNTENFWLNDKTPVGDSNGSCFINANKATLSVEMGGYL